MSHIGIQKAWNPTIAVPCSKALALPIILKRQREAHAEYKYTLVQSIYYPKVRVCARAYTQKVYQIGTRRIIYIP